MDQKGEPPNATEGEMGTAFNQGNRQKESGYSLRTRNLKTLENIGGNFFPSQYNITVQKDR